MLLVFSSQNANVVLFVVLINITLLNGQAAFITGHGKYYNNNSTQSKQNDNGFTSKIFDTNKLRAYLEQERQLSIPKQVLKYYVTKVLLTCNIIRKRTERTYLFVHDKCCSFLLNGDINEFYAKFCLFCSEYLHVDSPSIIKSALCKQKSYNLKRNAFFNIYNQKKKRKLLQDIVEKRSVSAKKRWKRAASTKGRQSGVTTKKHISTELPKTMEGNTSMLTVEPGIHVTKRELNETGNQTMSGLPDWETILQMQYSKDPQWALICVIFIVTLILGCVWYSGICKNRHGDFIDPVMTHNLQPEFVRDVVSRKARFLAWFQYLKNKHKQHRKKQTTEEGYLLSSSDDELYEEINLTDI